MKLILILLMVTPIVCSNRTKPIQNPQDDSLNIKNLTMMVWSLPFKHKDIIVAQAILETGWFKSKNYQVNNNLFGMKQIYSRATTADTTINGYSHYPNWKLSVIDYYIKQSTRENIISTNREQYYYYLDKVYSEVGSSYSSQLKDIIKREGLENDDPKFVSKKTKHIVKKKHTINYKKK